MKSYAYVGWLEARDGCCRPHTQRECGHSSASVELSPSLRQKWLTADYAARRRVLEIVCLNWTLDGVTLVPEIRKPFDMFAERLVSKDSRGDWHSFEPLIAAIVDVTLPGIDEAVAVVQATLGHCSVATTGKYLHARPNDSSGNYSPF